MTRPLPLAPADVAWRVRGRSRRLLIAVAVLLAACSHDPAPAPTVVGPAPGGLVMRPCVHRDTIPAECGTLTVPERRDVERPRLIAIPVVRIPATGSAPRDPIFFLNGGPGQTNVRLAPPAWARRDHDLVLVGFRGVDGSERLECPELSAAIDQPTGDLLGAASAALGRRALRACAERLQRTGIDLRGFTMADVVEDVEAARAALGYERLNLYSVSYGTRLAQLFASRYRPRVTRSVMVGVNTPGRLVWEPAQLDTVIHEFSRLCAQDAWCRQRTPDLAATVRRVAHHMPTNWGPFAIDRGVVLVATFAMLYDRRTAAVALDAFVDADHGDASGLALLSRVARSSISTSLVFGDLFAKASTDHDSTRAYTDGLDAPQTIMGAPMTALLWAPVGGTDGWPVVRGAPDTRTLAPSDLETLLIGGTLDVATPAVNATRELLPLLARGHQVILRDAGHQNLMEHQGAAYGTLVGGFFATGAVDTSAFRPDPMTFKVTGKLSRIVKLSALTGTLLVGGVALLVAKR